MPTSCECELGKAGRQGRRDERKKLFIGLALRLGQQQQQQQLKSTSPSVTLTCCQSVPADTCMANVCETPQLKNFALQYFSAHLPNRLDSILLKAVQ